MDRVLLPAAQSGGKPSLTNRTNDFINPAMRNGSIFPEEPFFKPSKDKAGQGKDNQIPENTSKNIVVLNHRVSILEQARQADKNQNIKEPAVSGETKIIVEPAKTDSNEQAPLELVAPKSMGPTPLEAAYIADHVYSGSGQLIGGWEVYNVKIKDVKFNNEKISFESAVYRRKKNNGEYEYVYATAGSSSIEDFVQNGKQLAGVSEQYELSIANAQIIQQELGENLTFVGHSLGGGLASANAEKTGGYAITFNAAAVSNFTKKHLGLNNKANITAFIVEGEIVDYMQKEIGMKAEGNIISLPASYAWKIPIIKHDDAYRYYQRVKNHMMSVVIEKLKENKYQ